MNIEEKEERIVNEKEIEEDIDYNPNFSKSKEDYINLVEIDEEPITKNTRSKSKSNNTNKNKSRSKSKANDKENAEKSCNNLFKIMITTDNHIGYLEHDQIRGNDSFNTFEEILIKAKENKVDFILHGGDLFHHHNPSKKTIIRASHILQKHIFGQKQHEFNTYSYKPNYFSDNLSIDLPIFIIHGNHDDPSGLENFSSIDIFSGKEVNYFGKVSNYDNFELYPIIFKKGNTTIAVYGIGNIKDERLYIALQNKRVKFHGSEDSESRFNILIVHQNRFKGHYVNKTRKNYLPESLIPHFFNLVIWGHEHECFTKAVYNSESELFVFQPGSSVATSMIAAESKMKHVGMLEVFETSFRIVPVKLETVRPFIYDSFELKDKHINNSDDIERVIIEKIENCLVEAKKLIDDICNNSTNKNVRKLIFENNLDKFLEYNEDKNKNKKKTRMLVEKPSVEESFDYSRLNINKDKEEIYKPLPILPLVRLKIETSGHIISRTNVIVSRFAGLLANPHDVLQFYKKPDTISNKNNTMKSNIDMNTSHTRNTLKESTNYDLSDEMIDWDDELKKFVISNITEEIHTNNRNLLLNPDQFIDALEKQANGLEKKSMESTFSKFFDSLCFKKNPQIKRLDWNFIKNYKIDDSNIAKKDNFKLVENIFKDTNFIFNNKKNDLSNMLNNIEKPKKKVINDDMMMFVNETDIVNNQHLKGNDNDEDTSSYNNNTSSSRFGKNQHNNNNNNKNNINYYRSNDIDRIEESSENNKSQSSNSLLEQSFNNESYTSSNNIGNLNKKKKKKEKKDVNKNKNILNMFNNKQNDKSVTMSNTSNSTVNYLNNRMNNFDLSLNEAKGKKDNKILDFPNKFNNKSNNKEIKETALDKIMDEEGFKYTTYDNNNNNDYSMKNSKDKLNTSNAFINKNKSNKNNNMYDNRKNDEKNNNKTNRNSNSFFEDDEDDFFDKKNTNANLSTFFTGDGNTQLNNNTANRSSLLNANKTLPQKRKEKSIYSRHEFK